MRHHAYVVHHVRGRMRLRLPRAKGDAAALNEIREFVCSIPGVSKVEVNPVTGSVLVQYDHTTQPEFQDELQRRGESEELLSLVMPEVAAAETVAKVVEDDATLLAQHSRAARAIVQLFDRFDLRIRRATNNAVGLQVLLLFGVATYSVIKSIREKSASPGWLILLLFALDTFIRRHEPRPGAMPGGRV